MAPRWGHGFGTSIAGTVEAPDSESRIYIDCQAEEQEGAPGTDHRLSLQVRQQCETASSDMDHP
ncbi:hypothetical protein N7481_013351 [Penicillium waksmanii]|uniref:uncharacterized protein n=1 Tax=Penicillium waksmanii TaxID=69791 RepID=UPI0025498540|nr:uncharacterized protein N7481_013351 [Penicillium waksmanii]KAJ5966637.1 hypothetical protein N7481_013351 [Penicillium waksmanii]